MPRLQNRRKDGFMRYRAFALPTPALALFLAATLGPVLIGLGFSLAYSVGAIGLLSQRLTLTHWQWTLGQRETWVSLGFSVWTALACLAVSVPLALALLYALGERVRRGVLGYLLYLPLATPTIVASLLSVELLGGSGVFSRLAYALGLIEGPAAFPHLLYDRAGLGIILNHTALVTPFLLLLFDRLSRTERAGSYEQLALSLGARRAQAWWAVVLPLLLRRAAPTLSVYFIFLLGAFEVPLLVGAQYPSQISVTVQRQFGSFDLANKPRAYALVALYLMLAMAALPLLVRRAHGRWRR